MAELSRGAQESPEQKGHLRNERIIKLKGVAWPSIKELKAISSLRKYLDPFLPGESFPTNSHNLPLHGKQGEIEQNQQKVLTAP